MEAIQALCFLFVLQCIEKWLVQILFRAKNKRNVRLRLKVLNIHRNTVMYRIEKIQELFGIDIYDTQVSFKLQLILFPD